MLNTALWAASQNTRTPVLPGVMEIRNVPQRTPMMSATIDNNSDFIAGRARFFHDRFGTASRRPCRAYGPGRDRETAMTGERVAATAQS
jgi:hypothetical protein